MYIVFQLKSKKNYSDKNVIIYIFPITYYTKSPLTEILTMPPTTPQNIYIF